MRKKIIFAVFSMIVAGGSLLFAGREANAQFMTKAVFARGFVSGDAKDVQVAFSPKDKIVYCVLGLDNPAPDKSFKFVWSLYNTATRQRSEVYTQELGNQSAKIFASKLSAPSGLTVGFYEVEVFIDGRSRKHLKFPVVKDQF